jgi:secreted protein with Ig-like and vWFA domain
VNRTVTFGIGGFDQSQPNNNVIWEVVSDEHSTRSLDVIGVFATLNAVLGIWSLEDAANAVNLAPADLIAEAQAWALAAK